MSAKTGTTKMFGMPGMPGMYGGLKLDHTPT